MRKYARIDKEKVFCCYCGKWIVYPLSLTSEHLVPVSKGGNNKLINKRPCCHKCNNWRGSKSLGSWRHEIKQLIRLGRTKLGYNNYDLEILLHNINYIKTYIDTSGTRLYVDKK